MVSYFNMTMEYSLVGSIID